MDLEPKDVTTLDPGDTRVITWSRIRDLLTAPSPPDEPGGYFPSYLSTVRPDGRPHTTGVGVRWYDGDLYFLSGAGSRKAKDLAANPASTIAAQVDGLDIVFDGSANPTTDPATMAAVGDLIRQSGWPVEVTANGFTAPFGPSGDPNGRGSSTASSSTPPSPRARPAPCAGASPAKRTHMPHRLWRPAWQLERRGD